MKNLLSVTGVVEWDAGGVIGANRPKKGDLNAFGWLSWYMFAVDELGLICDDRCGYG